MNLRRSYIPDINDKAEVRRLKAELQKLSAKLEDAISARVQAEEELLTSESKYRQLFNTMTSAIVIYEAVDDGDDFVFKDFNQALEKIEKIRREDIIGKRVSDVFPGVKASGLFKVFQSVWNTGNPEYFPEAVYSDERHPGSWRENWVYKLPGGEIVVIYNDITKRKQAENQILELKEFNEAIVNNLAEGIILENEHGIIQFANPAMLKMLGYEKDELLGKQWNIFIPDDQIEIVENANIRRCQGESDQYEIKLKKKSEERMSVLVSGVPHYQNGIFSGSLATFIDITEKIKLQSQLRQAMKMDSVGRLAGGVAHDFNNMLSVILGHTEMAMENMKPDQTLNAHLTEIRTAAERSADLTKQLLAFARKQTIAPRVLDLNETVEGMLKMLLRLIGEDIDLAWLPGTGVWPVKMDPVQIDQILVNLCVNARDAIGGVGKITLETENACVDETLCAAYPGFVPGEYVHLKVSDTGNGMDKETLSRLFEPFFTTKETGMGTGLGLAMVYGIVKQNGGFIYVYSEPDHGSLFRIYLPRFTIKSTAKPKEGVAAAPVRRGNETILLVEDEPAILELIKMMLEHLGYSVLAATTPGEAIRVGGEHAGLIDLLITDVVMPEMNGRDLARTLLSLYPNIRHLFMSGYTANVIAHQGVLEEGVHFIQKPFRNRDLAIKVREILDSE